MGEVRWAMTVVQLKTHSEQQGEGGVEGTGRRGCQWWETLGVRMLITLETEGPARVKD